MQIYGSQVNPTPPSPQKFPFFGLKYENYICLGRTNTMHVPGIGQLHSDQSAAMSLPTRIRDRKLPGRQHCPRFHLEGHYRHSFARC